MKLDLDFDFDLDPTPPPPAAVQEPGTGMATAAEIPLDEVLSQPTDNVIKTPEDILAALPGEKVSIRNRSLNELLAATTQGVLVTVAVQYYRGRSALTAEDLGFDKRTVRFAASHLRNGSKIVIPPELLRTVSSAENMLRATVKRYGFQLDRYGQFIPLTQFQAFKGRFEHYKKEFLAAVEAIAEAVDGNARDRMKVEFRTLAVHAWKGLRDTWTEDGGSAPGAYSNSPDPTPLFVERYVERVISKIPPADDIRKAAQASYYLEVLRFPDTDLAVAFAGSPIEADLREHMAQEKREKIDSFLRAARDAIATQVQEMLANVQSKLATKGRLHRRSLTAILGSVAELRQLNVLGDKGVDSMLARLEKVLAGVDNDATVAKSDIDIAAVVHHLQVAAADAVKLATDAMSEIEEFEL